MKRWIVKLTTVFLLMLFFFVPVYADDRSESLSISDSALSSEMETPFTDVASGAYYADAVAWAVEQGITKGTTETTFSPNATTTRGNVVTFLWRWAGETEPDSSVKDFSDVGQNRYCYSSVLWAVERGVTLGSTETTFSPDNACTYSHVLTFLWRFLGSPAPEGTGIFAGNYEGRYYKDAVEWAEEQGLLNNCLADFSPSKPCPRSDVVQFLYLIGRLSVEECLLNFEDRGLFDVNGGEVSVTLDMVASAELWTYGAWNDRPGEHNRMLNVTDEQAKRLIWVIIAKTPYSLGGLPTGGPQKNVTLHLVCDALTGKSMETGYAFGQAD